MWQQVFAHAQARESVPDTSTAIALRFPLDGDLAATLARLSAAEYRCCAFGSYTIVVDATGLRLEIRVPNGAAGMLAAVFGTADTGRRPMRQTSRDEVRPLLDTGTTLVEALPEPHYTADHLPSAVNLPGDLTVDPATALAPDRDQTVVTYCSGASCARSKAAAAAFTRLGYTDVRVYTGGESENREELRCTSGRVSTDHTMARRGNTEDPHRVPRLLGRRLS